MAGVLCRNCGIPVTKATAFCSDCGVRNPAIQSLIGPAAAQPVPKPRARERRRSDSAGVILGVAGSCFGILGIFTLGLVFVPFAILFSLFGLLRALGGRSLIGAVVSLVGLTFSAIGFATSPSLLLLSGGLMLASNANHAETKRQSAVETQESQLPSSETRFCQLTASASQLYFDLAKEAEKAANNKNGVMEKRARDGMTAMAKKRNADVYSLAQESLFKFENWNVQLLKIDSPGKKYVTFSVRPACSNIVTIHLSAPVDEIQLDKLSEFREGDSLLASGLFVGSRIEDDATPDTPTAGRFEQSITERGSMEEPEFQAILQK